MGAPTTPSADATALAGAEDRVVVIDHRPSIPAMLRETWSYRGLVPRLGLRQLVKGVAGTKLGHVWWLLRPLVSILGMALLFGSVLRAPSAGVPYLLFLLTGMVGWMAFERTLFWGTRSFDIYRKVSGRLGIPMLLVPTAALAPMAVEVGIVAGITVATAGFYWITEGALDVATDASLLLAVAGVALAIPLGWGLSLWLATLNAMARDVRLVLRFVLPLWMYVTPVIYPVTALPDRWRWLADINPATAPVEMVRAGLLGEGSVRGASLALTLAATAVLCTSGLWFLCHRAPVIFSRTPAVDDEEDQ